MAELTRTLAASTWREGWGRTAGVGVLAGLVSSILMGMFAMVAAATYQNTGFFTPLYHIASPLIGGDAMMSSMDAAGRGDLFTLDAGPALLGLAIHMMWGAVWGVVFFALARAAHVRGAPTLILAGVVFGLVVMLFMSWITLPITAEVVGGGRAIEDMPAIVGWGTFSVEHVLFGLVPGIWAAARRKVAATGSATGSEERHEPRLAA